MKWNVGILLLFLLMGSAQVDAQRARYKPQAHEMGIQLGSAESIFPFLARGDYDGSMPLAALPASGIRYTYHASLENGFRIGFYNRRARLSDSTSVQTNVRIARQIQLGYERKYHNGPHQISYGPEILLNMGRTDYPDQINGIESFPFQSIGAAFALGYSYFFSPYMSAGIEGNLFYINPSYSTVLDNPEAFPAYLYQENITGINVGVWLNFHFIKMKKSCKCPSRR